MPAAAQPLRGITVLDFTRILAGPYATLLLADLGAEVIKVERPGQGDDTRWWGPPFLAMEDGLSTYFASLNRGKKSIAVDLQSSDGRALIRRLVEHCDVTIENFRPHVASRLGLDHAALSTTNPRIVTCSISGFGPTGPYADLPGTEIIVEAMSGLMSITGPEDGEPVRFGIAMVDIATGLTAATRILAHVMQARETGRGAHVECSLYSTAMSVLGTLITSYSATGLEPRRWGSHHPTVCPYGGFATADGHIITGVINDASWPAFCDALEVPELCERGHLATNAGRVAARQEVESAIERVATTRSTRHWVQRLRQRGLLVAPVRSVREAVEDPATRGMGLFVELEGHPGVVSPRLDGQQADDGSSPAPSIGAHTTAVLRSFGVDDVTIDSLLSRGVIAVDATPAPDPHAT